RDPGDVARRDQAAGHDARRRGVRRSVRQAGRVRLRAEGLRPRRAAVPALPDADRDGQDLPAHFVLLPAVPELSAGAQTTSAPTTSIRSIARSPSPGVRSTARIPSRSTVT